MDLLSLFSSISLRCFCHKLNVSSVNLVAGYIREISPNWLFLYSHHLSDWQCMDNVRRNKMLITVECTSLEASQSPNTRDVPFKLMKPSLFRDHLCFWHGSAGLASWVLRTCRLTRNVNIKTILTKQNNYKSKCHLVLLLNSLLLSDCWLTGSSLVAAKWLLRSATAADLDRQPNVT